MSHHMQRSRSAPHVAPLQPFLVPPTRRAQDHPPAKPAHSHIRRHNTTLALTELAATSTSSPRSGYQTPRADRTEDPFSLGGFFPSQLPARPDADWSWLRSDDDAAEAAADELLPELDDARSSSDGTHPAYGLDVDSDEDELLPSSRAVFDNTEDVRTEEMILREDKLGVLSMSAMFSSAHGESQSLSGAAAPYDRLLSPYCEDNPLDQDAVYQSWAQLRQTHAMIASSPPPRTLDGCSGPLFAPVEDVKVSEYEEEQSVLSRGIGVVLDLLLF